MSIEQAKNKSKSFMHRFSNDAMYERKKAKLLKRIDREYVRSHRRKEIAELEEQIRGHRNENRNPKEKEKRKVKIGGYSFSI